MRLAEIEIKRALLIEDCLTIDEARRFQIMNNSGINWAWNSLENLYRSTLLAAMRASGAEAPNLKSPFEESYDILDRSYQRRERVLNLGGQLFVGYTYWYGGGEYGNPASIDWIGFTYFVKHRRETVEVDVFDPIPAESTDIELNEKLINKATNDIISHTFESFDGLPEGL